MGPALLVRGARGRPAAPTGPSAGPAAPAPATAPAPAPAAEPLPRVHPPRPAAAWTAEQRWSADVARFEIVARTEDEPAAEVVVAVTSRATWPPAGTQDLLEAIDAVTRVQDAMAASGWRVLAPGEAWFATRFAWEPVRPADADAGAAALPLPPPAAAAPPPARRTLPPRHLPWPDGADALWRCEIRWRSGYARSAFCAVVIPPGGRRGRAVAGAEPFRWQLKGEPDPQAPAFPAAVQRLAGRLAAAGWERAGRDRAWYAERFVWRGGGPPPT